MSRMKKISGGRGKRVQSKRMRRIKRTSTKKRTRRSSNKRMRRSFIKKSRSTKRSLRRMRGGSDGVLDINTFTLTDSDGSHPVYPPNSLHENPPDFRGKTLGELHAEREKYNVVPTNWVHRRQIINDGQYLKLNIIKMKIYLKDEFVGVTVFDMEKQIYENLFTHPGSDRGKHRIK